MCMAIGLGMSAASSHAQPQMAGINFSELTAKQMKELAVEQTDMMKDALELDAAQYKKVLQLNLNRIKVFRNTSGGFGGGFGMGGTTSAPVNFNALDAKTIKKNKVQELGTEVIAGRECTIYSVRVLMMQQYQTNRYWVYKGIVMQSETAGFMDDEPMLNTVTELQECEVPADIFTVPEGIKVTERDFGGMGFGGGMMMGGGDFGGGMGGFGGGMGF